jgi:hypothetical protein
MSGQKLSQKHRIVQAQKEHMLVKGFDRRLLREVKGAEAFSIDKVHLAVHRLEFVLGFVGNVFAGNKVQLERVELLSKEI